ncbi:MAG: DUF3794 domain-containing protein [Ruminococcus sp.]|nr:DUF3794 domain-containing protein [Ruminococcus sp.]
MNLKINRETIPAGELVYSGIQEQGVELDYILPDYCPDIFRLVRCEVIPAAADYSVMGSTLSYELSCEIRLIYCGEDGTALQCITQKQLYTKTVDLGKAPNSPEVSLSPKTDHVNFRAVNKRRLDVRGAVSVKISVKGENSEEVISDAFGLNVQLKKTPMRYASKKLNGDKVIQLTEETELSAAQPAIIGIIRCDARVGECEKKIISGKLLAKGNVSIRLLYSCESGLEPLELTVPFSQIIDMDGIDETFSCNVSAEVVSCTVTPVSDKNGENRSLKIEPELRITCRAVKISEIMAVADAYSTVYPCETEFSEIHAEQPPVTYAESFRHSAKLAEGEAVPKKIFAMWCSPKNINTRLGNDGKSVIISGMLTYSMAAEDASGSISMPDRDEAFEETVNIGDDMTNSSVTAVIGDIAVSYNISDQGVLMVKADIPVRITAESSSGSRAVTGLIVDDSVKKQRDGDYAVKLYFGSDNEDIWDIAKRFSTEADAIMEENELTAENLANGRMLLIPIKE